MPVQLLALRDSEYRGWGQPSTSSRYGHFYRQSTLRRRVCKSPFASSRCLPEVRTRTRMLRRASRRRAFQSEINVSFFYFSIPHTPTFYFLLPWSVRWILPCHPGARASSLFWISAFPHIPLYQGSQPGTKPVPYSSAVEDAIGMVARDLCAWFR